MFVAVHNLYLIQQSTALFILPFFVPAVQVPHRPVLVLLLLFATRRNTVLSHLRMSSSSPSGQPEADSSDVAVSKPEADSSDVAVSNPSSALVARNGRRCASGMQAIACCAECTMSIHSRIVANLFLYLMFEFFLVSVFISQPIRFIVRIWW